MQMQLGSLIYVFINNNLELLIAILKYNLNILLR